MTDNKLVLWALIGCLVASAVWSQKDQIIESFGMLPSQVVRVEQVVHGGPSVPLKGDMFKIPGTYQAMLQPRQAGNVDYGPMLRYNMPDKSKRADSMGSLYAGVAESAAKESYCGPCGAGAGAGVESYCGKEHYAPSGPVSAPPAPMDMMPASSMGMNVTNELGEMSQPIVYDRFIFANQKDRLKEGADFIRGDLPIVPMAKGWFAPSGNPVTALRQGALQVIGGADGDTSRDLAALKMAAMGNIQPPAQASMAFSSKEVPSYTYSSSSAVSGAGGDIQVTRFP